MNNKVRRIAAIIGIVLILSMYLVSFISSFFATKYSYGLFIASVFSTIVIPIMIWWFITIYKWVHKNDKPVNPDEAGAPNNTEQTEIPDDATKENILNDTAEAEALGDAGENGQH
jgi:amino acid permease